MVIVLIFMQLGRERESRRVSFTHGLQDALHVEQSDELVVHIAEARLEQSQVVVTDTDMDALLEIVQSGESVVHDTSMPDRQVERSCSCESRREVVVQESMHEELEHDSSSESQ